MNKGSKHTKFALEKIREARKRQGSNVGIEKRKGKHYSIETEFKKGQSSWNKGVPKEKSHLFGRSVSSETKRKIGEKQKGEKNHNWRGGRVKKICECGSDYLVWPYQVETVKHCSHRCAMLKSKHWNWKGGITPVVKQIRNCFNYRQWVSDCFQRDDYTCLICQKRGGVLHVDHKKPFSFILRDNTIRTLEDALLCEELWNINNGRTLCVDCHIKYGENPRNKKS